MKSTKQGGTFRIYDGALQIVDFLFAKGVYMKKVGTADFPAFEAEMLRTWESEKTFEKSMEQRKDAPNFSFYDGPPFANGLPHFGHSLVTAIKDSLGRYKTMQGYYVARRNGWDCHGLPVEFAIEKQLGVSGKRQIMEEVGLEKFNQACRDSVFLYKADWEAFFRRIGRWTQTEEAYASIDRDYTESVWWVLGQVNQKGLLYKGYKSMPYCPRCETPLSNFELNEGYKDDVSDPSVYVKFAVVGKPGTYFLAWTTTPWTLAANSALAVDGKADYVKVELLDDGDSWKKGDRLILAKARLDVLDLRKAEYKVLETKKGKELAGTKYLPLYNVERLTDSEKVAAYQMYVDSSASIEDGTGIVHTGTRYGETDLDLCLRMGLPMIETVDRSGHMTKVLGDEIGGMFFKKADKYIIEDLTKQGKIFAAETFKHTYPFCYRCDSPLLYFAITTWFVGVSTIRDKMLKTAQEINWTPGHIKDGRFGKWLEGARDWAISRNRYWGAPLPIWVNEADENDYIVISSMQELRDLAGEDTQLDDLHRPFIDEVIFEKDGKKYKRVEEVFDCWFESGSMPVAQQHYPFENKEVFEKSFPADYIGEGLDQTRLWFYVQHVLATILFDRPAYKNVLVNGMIMAADGQKLSKRLKNYPPVEDVFGKEGADTLRFYLLGNDQALSADYMRFNREAMVDIQRNVFSTLWNTLSFLSMYAEIDKWQSTDKLVQPKSKSVLDQWILARLNQTIGEMTVAADKYEIAAALRPLRNLVDDLSNWYVRRSRRRFWKSEDDSDKASAYATLHYTLARICQLLAPWAPFAADKMWRELMAGTEEAVSVHLSDWPKAEKVDKKILESMSLARQVITEALAQRAEKGRKVRQPLSRMVYSLPNKIVLGDDLNQIIMDEVNVKSCNEIVSPDGKLAFYVDLNTEITQELAREGLVREVVRHVQTARKNTGLDVDDRINLALITPNEELQAAIEQFDKLIIKETLTTGFSLELGVRDTTPPVMAKEGGLWVELSKV